MKRIAFIICLASFAAAIAISCGQSTENKEEQVAETTIENNEIKTEDMETKKIEEPVFDIVTSHGTMRILLYSKTPQHRDNFVKHVSNNFYDGIRFHRVIDGFMIQAGDPYSRDLDLINKWGTGGPSPDYTVPAEFVEEYHHKKGALAAARKGDLANPKKASSGSQFYIVQDEDGCSHLDGQYTVFGEVISGLEVIDNIASTATDRYNRPMEDIIITTIKPVVETAEETAPADSTLTK